MQRLANPAAFLALAARILPWAAWLTAILIALGLYLALFVAPPDYQQGESVRIMFVHVPAAWMALMVYGVMAATSGLGLVMRHPLAFLVAKASAPIGAGFTLIALVTGSLWGQPMWGTWWVWDARLTSVLLLLFLYLGYIALWEAMDDPQKASRATAILALVGALNLPVIKFSVDWWNTLHQPASVVRLDGPAIHPAILWPLLVMAAGFMGYYLVLVLLRVRGEISARRIRNLRLRQGAYADHRATGAASEASHPAARPV